MYAEPKQPLVVARKVAASALAISERTLWQLTADGEIPCVRIGKKAVRYRVSDLERYVAEQSSGGQSG